MNITGRQKVSVEDVVKLYDIPMPHYRATPNLAAKILTTCGYDPHAINGYNHGILEQTVETPTRPFTGEIEMLTFLFTQASEIEEHAYFTEEHMKRLGMKTSHGSVDYYNIAVYHWILSGQRKLFREQFSKSSGKFGTITIRDLLQYGLKDKQKLHEFLDDWGREFNPEPLSEKAWKEHIKDEENYPLYQRLLAIRAKAN